MSEQTWASCSEHSHVTLQLRPRRDPRWKLGLLGIQLFAALYCAHLSDIPESFARKHAHPATKRELLAAIQSPDLSLQDQRSMLTSLQGAFEADIAKWGHRRQWHVALADLDQMRMHSVDETVSIYNAAIHACGEKVRQWERAMVLLEEMSHKSLVPNRNSYRRAMNACTRSSQWGKALELYEEMKLQKLSPDEDLFSSALYACQMSATWQAALVYLQDMEALEFEPGGDEFNKVIDACDRAGVETWSQFVEDEAASRGFELQI